MDKKLLNFKKTFPGFNETLESDFSDVHAYPDNELFDVRGRLRDSYKRLLERCEHEKRDLNAVEDEAVNFANELLTEMDHEVTRRTRKPAKSIQLHGKNSGGKKEDAARNETRNGAVGLTGEEIFGTGMGEYRDAADFYTRAALAMHSPETRTQIIGQGTLGGFAVPATLSSTIYDNVVLRASFLNRATVWRSETPQFNVPFWDSADQSLLNAQMGFAQWLPETGTATPTDAKLRLVELVAKKLVCYLNVSRECMNDAIPLARQIEGELTKNLQLSLDYSIFDGSGVGQPLGFMRSPAKISVNRAVANQIAYNDVISMYCRLAPWLYSGAAWFVSPSAVEQIIKLADAGNNSVWVANAAPGTPGTLFGLPVVVTPFNKQLGTEGDCVLANLGEYALMMRQEIILESSNSAYWLSDQMAFRAILRADGQCTWDKVVTPISGPTLSCIVTLV